MFGSSIILLGFGVACLVAGVALLSDTLALNDRGLTLDLELKPETAMKIGMVAIAMGLAAIWFSAHLFQSSLPIIPTGPYT